MSTISHNGDLLAHSEFIYTRMVALSWSSDPTLQPSIFSSFAGKRLVNCLEHHGSLPVIINCTGTSTIVDHALDEFCQFLLSNSREAIFILDKSFDQLKREIESELQKSKSSVNVIDMDNKILIYTGAGDFVTSIRPTLMKKIKETEVAFINNAIKKSYTEFTEPQRLTSTPLLATGVLNARKLISEPGTFIWIAILLADLLKEVIERQKPAVTRLLAVSLRASPFAAAVKMLAQEYSPSLEIVDHIGPQHEILEEHSFYPEDYSGEYIYVGDFVIGGTELKIARSYAFSKGWSLNSAIAIGSYLPPEQYDKNITLKTLVNVAKLVPQLSYEFKGE